jgi:hypothetical protein
MGHRMFWSALIEGKDINFDKVLGTQTFWILSFATVVGAIFGGWVANRIVPLQKKPGGS